MIITICNIYGFSEREQQLLPHFIRHYKDKLNTEIIFCCDENNKELKNFCYKNKIKHHEFDFEYDKVYGIVDSIRINKVKDIYKCWYIPADVDEFIELDSNNHILSLINSCLDNNFKYVSGHFRDRFVSKNKILEKINPNIEIQNQFPHTESFTKEIMKAYDQKVCLTSPDLDVNAGHHTIEGDSNLKNIYKNKYFDLNVDHYKWFGNVIKSEKNKMKIRLKNKSKYYIQQQNLLNYFNENFKDEINEQN